MRSTLSATSATPGYKPYPLVQGEWGILVGAYKVAPEGVTVTYELEFTMKHLRLFKGDLHTHTLASDGVLTLEELAAHALRHGLDFLAITDHNQPGHAESFPRIPGLTLIPGVEWTHYRGHANFLGVDQPYDGSFMANTPEEVSAHFQAARSRGAFIIVNHPFDEGSAFLFDLNALPFDCLEVWNGPMREANLRAMGLWQGMLAAGKKIPICGGSDYHRDSPFQILGGPTTCIYAASAGPCDILAALKAGHAFMTFAPNGPAPRAERRGGDARGYGSMVCDEGNADCGKRAVEWGRDPRGDREQQRRYPAGSRGGQLHGRIYPGGAGLCAGRGVKVVPARNPDAAGVNFKPDLFRRMTLPASTPR